MDKKQIESISKAWQEVYEKKTLDPVDPKELKGKHKDREDGDIDNDGDTDSSDQYLHKKRKAISKAVKESDDEEMGNDEPMAKDGMKKCAECGGSTENHDQECSKYASSEKGKSVKDESSCGGDTKKVKKEAVRHEDHGYGEIIAESDEGVDVLFAHGVEFNVPAEQLEGVSSAIKTARRMGGNMTGAVKKIDKSKKGMSDNPRVQKALRKANEEVEEVSEKTVAQLDDHVQETYRQAQGGIRGALSQMWEAAVKAKEGPKGKPDDDIDANLKGKGAKDMAKDADHDSPDVPKGGDDEQGHVDATKAGRVVSQAPARPGDQKTGDKKIVNPVKGATLHTTGKE